MVSHAEKVLLRSNNGIVLCRGINAEQKSFWLYIQATLPAIERMHRDYESGSTVNFLDYGKVLFKGLGKQVPEEIRSEMESLYGFQHESDAA